MSKLDTCIMPIVLPLIFDNTVATQGGLKP